MDFRYLPEEEAFQAEVEEFLRAEWDPNRGDRGEGFLVDTPEKRTFVQKMSKKGWLGFGWPVEYGGTDQPGMHQFILNEALAYANAPITGTEVGTVGMTLIHHGNERLKAEFLPAILRGDLTFALGYSEPEAGSDLANLQLRAVRDGDDYVFNGQKRFTSAAHCASHVWLAARTNPDAPKHRGISLFILEMDAPGISVRPLWTMGGGRTNEVYYDNVRVPAYRLVGEENRGWYYVAEALDYERFAIYPFGFVRRAVEEFINYARTAQLDGRVLRDDPSVRQKVARLAIEMEVGWMLQLRGAHAANQGAVPHIEATMNKLFATTLQQRLYNAALDIMGLYGQLQTGSKHAQAGGRFERAYQSSVVATIAGGTSEVQKNIIAKRELGLPG
jgi:alkylation response protein AidB-like acyl-CoA dehydrogenase